MINTLSNKMRNIKPSPTLEVTAQASALKMEGIDIISLSVGEPDLLIQNHIKESIINAIKDNKTKYTAVDGIIELKEAIKNKYINLYNLKYDLANIIISTGGKQVIYNLFSATLNEGDEVIIPCPYWGSYPDMVKLCGGNPVILNTDTITNFKITPQKLEEHITSKTKWLIINSPTNPTGETYTKSELESIGKLLAKYPNVNILSDDIYEHILYEGNFYNLAMTSPEIKSRVFMISGVSKTYSMTGLRIGYGIGNPNIVKTMKIIQSQSTSNPSSICQYGALEAINGKQGFIESNNMIFRKRGDFLFDALNKIKGIRINKKPSGTFYLFPACSDLFGLKTASGKIINNSTDFACFLLEEARVAIVPGIAFGAEGYFRISYAVSLDNLKLACNNIKKAIDRLK